jgi:UDP-N-acetylglucosamine pyrophosphorylase
MDKRPRTWKSAAMSQVSHFAEFVDKMRKAGASDAAIRTFEHSYSMLLAGDSGLISEATIDPVRELPKLEDLPGHLEKIGRSLVSQTLFVKLNGGLGTSMGLDKAKSLLPIKGELTFLDFIARQVLHVRKELAAPLRFMLMNSFSTSADTLSFLNKYRELGDPKSFELLQNFVPKVDAETLRPASWPTEPGLEWCPPGHGDLYPALLGSGWLDRLLNEGVKFMFVSNADNLGASLDLQLLGWFADSGKPFLMEVCERTASDRKGGHLAQRRGRLLLRESAQCPKEDEALFQDVERHRFFNTNNLWVRLDELKRQLDATGGFIRLPVIKNVKTVDPRNPNSPAVFQLETAMGAAIECFDNAGAILVPRTRFAPVKTTSDLLAVRSDAYEVTGDCRLALAPSCGGLPPAIDLDSKYYKLVDQLDEKLQQGVPSLKDCKYLTVHGPVAFQNANTFRGNVEVTNNSRATLLLPAAVFANQIVPLG